jgi:NADH dehydrogenase FAD-containing subunit
MFTAGVFILIKILLIGAGGAHRSILNQLKKERINNIEITLISSSKTDEIYQLCEKASVTFIEDTVISFDPLQKMILSFSGEIHRFDVISFDSDLKFSLFKQALVPVDANGSLLVEDTLQNTEFPFIFGAGDCASIPNHTKNAVSPAEQGIVLWNNIKRYIYGKKLKPLNSGTKVPFFDDWLGRLFKR